MVILLVNNGDREKDFYESVFSHFAEPDTIIEVGSVSEAKDFISTTLVDGGQRVDLVVTNFAFDNEIESAIDLMVWLKSGSGLSYYEHSLQLPALPVVLLHTIPGSTETERLLGFDRIIEYGDLDNQKRIEFVIESTVRSWVDALLSDYDLLRVDPYNPFLFLPIIWNYKCEVLARGYASYPRRMPFLVFQRDIERTEAAIEDFNKTIQRISQSLKPKQEKQYHALLKKYPEFIRGELYDEIFYEKNFLLRSGSLENFEPDFIRRHTFYKFNKIANVLEIKLPNDKFISGSKFHPTLSSRLVRNLTQVKDYQNYFGDRNRPLS